LIKLFDNKATTKWFNEVSKMKFNSAYQMSTFLTLPKEDRDKHILYIQSRWNGIRSILNYLTRLDFKIPFEIPDKYDFDQNKLNLLHRFFTYNAMWHHDMNSLENCKNPFDPNFKTDYDYNKWHKMIDVINQFVHRLERFTETPNKEILKDYPLHTIYVDMGQNSSLESWITFDLEEQKENYKYRLYLLTGKPLVLLDNSILGKSYLQSFLEHDDPTCKDCTGRIGSFGNFLIDLNRNRNKIYNSAEFKNWLSKYNIKNPPLEFPIGQVLDHNIGSLENLYFKGSNFKVEDVIFTKTI
jgi:hypothetical protein